MLGNFGQNGPEINEKTNVSRQSFQFLNIIQIVFCGILENYSSFCTRKRVVIKLFKL